MRVYVENTAAGDILMVYVDQDSTIRDVKVSCFTSTAHPISNTILIYARFCIIGLSFNRKTLLWSKT